MLEVIATSDPSAPYALSRRHRSPIDGRMVDTVISRWPTRNSAHDAWYAEVHGLIVGKPAARSATAVTAGIVATTALAICIGAAALWFGAGTAHAARRANAATVQSAGHRT